MIISNRQKLASFAAYIIEDGLNRSQAVNVHKLMTSKLSPPGEIINLCSSVISLKV